MQFTLVVVNINNQSSNGQYIMASSLAFIIEHSEFIVAYLY